MISAEPGEVPVWYNKAKSEKPLLSRAGGFEGILFQHDTNQNTGQNLYLKTSNVILELKLCPTIRRISMGKVLVIANRKGGCGKSMTAASLGVGFARQGKKTLIIDANNQHSLSISMGVSSPDELPVSLSTVMSDIINKKGVDPTAGIIHHSEGVDLMPSNNSLAGMEIVLASLIGRETVLRQYIEKVKPLYDYCLIDTAPTLDLLTVNALAAADSVIIPVVPKYLDAKVLGS